MLIYEFFTIWTYELLHNDFSLYSYYFFLFITYEIKYNFLASLLSEDNRPFRHHYITQYIIFFFFNFDVGIATAKPSRKNNCSIIFFGPLNHDPDTKSTFAVITKHREPGIRRRSPLIDDKILSIQRYRLIFTFFFSVLYIVR